MKRIHVAAVLSALILTVALGQAQEPAIRFESFKRPEGMQEDRIRALGQVLGFREWPEREGLFVGPAVSRSLLREPALVSREARACTTVTFNDLPWGKCEWSWNELDVEVVLAPTARAAQEYMLSAMTDNTLPTEALVGIYKRAERPAGLGSVAFLTRSRSGDDVRVRFTRANVALHIRATGRMSAEVLPLARRLDALLLSQQPLTARQLLERRPAVTISRPARGKPAVPFNLSVPKDQVMEVHAFVDGQTASAQGGTVSLGERKGEVEVEVTTITRDLLAGSARLKVTF